MEELDLLDQVPHYVPISAKDEWNLVRELDHFEVGSKLVKDDLLEKIWEYCQMIRIYTKPRVRDI